MSELFTYRVRIKPEWIDHNGHLNVAYFVLAFDFATDAIYEEWGIGSAYQEQSGCSVFTLGMNVDYLKELFSGDEIEIRTQLLDWDYNKIHYFHSMWHTSIGKMAASNECLAMNIRLKDKKRARFPIKVQQRLAEIYSQHTKIKKPKRYGRRIGINDQTVLDVL
jgi:acyl-CoA thioester hydrolase